MTRKGFRSLVGGMLGRQQRDIQGARAQWIHRGRLLADRLSKFAKNVIVLKGGMGVRERRRVAEALESIPDGEERVLVATGRYLGEGFDDARLDTLFLTMPISWRGTLAQYAGRLHRLHTAKREVVVYDYLDDGEPMLVRMAAKREAGGGIPEPGLRSD